MILDLSHSRASDSACRPSRLKVKAPCDAIEVNTFTRKKEIGDTFTLHRFKINVLPSYPSAGDKLIFVSGFSLRMVQAFSQFAEQRLLCLLGKLRPSVFI